MRHRNYFPRLLLLLVCLLLLTQPVMAGERPVRVGYIPTPGYMTVGAAGHPEGVLYEYIETVSMYTDFALTYVPLTADHAMTALENGEIDMLAGVLSPDNYDAPQMTFALRSSATATLYLAQPAGGRPVTPGRPAYQRPHVPEDGRPIVGYYAPLYESCIAYPKFFTLDPSLKEYDFQAYDSEEDMVNDCQQGAIQGCLTSSIYLNEALSLERVLGHVNVYLAFPKENAGLADQLNEAVEMSFRIAPEFRSAIATHAQGISRPLVLSPEERAYLKNHPVLRVPIPSHQPPYSGFAHGRATGVTGRITDRIAQDLGITFEYVKATSTKERLEMLSRGEVDLCMSVYADFTWAAKYNARLTNPYLNLDYMAVTRRDTVAPSPWRIAYPVGSLYVNHLVRPRYPDAQYLEYSNIQECFAAVDQGEADITFAKAITVQQELADADHPNLRSGSSIVFSHPIAIGIGKHIDPILLRIINKELAYIGQEEVDHYINEGLLSVKYRHTWRTFLQDHPVGVPLGITLLALIAIGTLLYIIRQRKASEKQLFRAAYINPFTGMKTLRWFEKFIPMEIQQRYTRDWKEGRLFLLNVLFPRFDVLRATYTQTVIYEGLRRIQQDVLRKNPWILEQAISYELSQILLLGRLSDGMTLQDAADRILEDGAVMEGQGGSIRLDRHMGLAMLPPAGDTFTQDDLNAVMVNAAIARNEAAACGQNIGIYNSEIQARRVREKSMEDLMYKALENEEFQVWLQPKYHLGTHKIIGAESLVRWQSPELGFLMPGQFIQLFENNGFIIPFDYYMLEHVCRMQRARLAAGQPIVPIAVNQSGLHMQEAGYLRYMQAITDLYALPADAVELEITETALIDYDTGGAEANAAIIVAELHKMGYAIAMDDFCTGYSSIAMLQQLPMDIMKIDRTMLLASEQSPRGETVLRNVIGFGRSLDMKILCEGIETPAQEDLLRRHNCPYGQGFLFGKPMPAEKFFEFLEEHGVYQENETP